MDRIKQESNKFNFRTLNYLGCKLRLLDFIEEHVRRITPEGAGVCDLFAGSGCVAYRLSHQHPVTACDVQNYSTVICNAMLRRPPIPDFAVKSFLSDVMDCKSEATEEAFSPLIELEERGIVDKDANVLAEIVEHGSVEIARLEDRGTLLSSCQRNVCNALRESGVAGQESFVSRHYGGVYFSYRQAVRIDAILSAIRRNADNPGRDVFLAALLSSASDVVDTVGKHFAQPIKARDSKGKIKPLVCRKAVQDKTIDIGKLYEDWVSRYLSLPTGKHSHVTIQGDCMECLAKLSDDVKTVYADPPYTREHYSRFYHVLETIALGDMPEISKVVVHGVSRISNGIYRAARYQSPFCIRSKAPKAFCEMFRSVSEGQRNLLLSYSPYDTTKKTHPRVVTTQQLVSWARQYFARVEVVSAGRFTHSKLNSSNRFLESSDEAEQLIICTHE